jgi:hypothetical protein
LSLFIEVELTFEDDHVNLLADAAKEDCALLSVQRKLLEVHVAHRRELALEVEAA